MNASLVSESTITTELDLGNFKSFFIGIKSIEKRLKK